MEKQLGSVRLSLAGLGLAWGIFNVLNRFETRLDTNPPDAETELGPECAKTNSWAQEGLEPARASER